MLKLASLADIKVELQALPRDELLALCLRLARFKQDNKELLSYLLFSAHNTDAFMASARRAISSGFAEVNTTSNFLRKKNATQAAGPGKQNSPLCSR
jgi:hypothetical protein